MTAIFRGILPNYNNKEQITEVSQIFMNVFAKISLNITLTYNYATLL